MAKPKVQMIESFLILTFFAFCLHCDAATAHASVVGVVDTGSKPFQTSSAGPAELHPGQEVAAPAASPVPSRGPTHSTTAGELQMIPESLPGLCDYKITIKTGDVVWAGTDSNIALKLENARNEGIRISSVRNDNNDFEAGSTDVFTYEYWNCISAICRMTLFTDDSGWFPGWLPVSVEVVVSNSTGPVGGQDVTWLVQEWLPTSDDANFVVRDQCRN